MTEEIKVVCMSGGSAFRDRDRERERDRDRDWQGSSSDKAPGTCDPGDLEVSEGF